MNTWFTSDTHFGHTNIITYCGRPFVKADGQPDVGLMNDEMVRRWNERVAPDDVVWHLGDFSFGPSGFAAEMARRLAGKKHLVRGNHDRLTNTQYRLIGFEPHKRERMYIDGKRIRLVHNPQWLGDLDDYDLAFVGHVHERWRERVLQGKRVINVGVDVRGFRPVSFAELLEG